MRYKQVGIPIPDSDTVRNLQTWLPNRGNVVFTTLMIMLLVWAQSAGAFPALSSSAASTGTIAYQGRLADSGGNPLTTTVNMTFRLYNAATGGTPLWTEDWTGPNGVQVSDGLFNVMLGSLTAIPQNVITGNPTLFLGITAGTDDEMSPRVQLGSVPFAVQALTVPNGSVTTPKLADKSVTQAKLGADVSLVPPDGSITTAKLADGAATGLWYAVGSSSTTTNSTSWKVIPEMNLDIVTIGKPIVIDFDTGFQANNPDAGYVAFGVFVDGAVVTQHAQRVDRGGESTSVHLSWVVALSPGNHKIDIRWLVSGTGLNASIGATNIWEQRVLTVREIRR